MEQNNSNDNNVILQNNSTKNPAYCNSSFTPKYWVEQAEKERVTNAQKKGTDTDE